MGKTKESLISNEKECYLCGNPTVHKHHIYKGVKCRKIADEQGLWVYLCPKHHEQVHSDRDLDVALMRFGQQLFEKTHTREEFRKLFIKSYL